jgi:S1-C subfamily serine protease
MAAIGYPASSERGTAITVTPTVTLGVMRRQLSGDADAPAGAGARLLQFSASVEHGDSGGPGVDSEGNVQGMVSFGDVERNESFLVSATEIRTVLMRTGARNVLGPADRLYRAAVRSQESGDSRAAASLLSQCRELNPSNVYCSRGVSGLAGLGGLLRTRLDIPGSTSNPLPAGIALVALESAIIIAIRMLLPRRRDRTQMTGAV